MIRAGHTEACCGAVDSMNEQAECLPLKNRVIELLRSAGDTVVDATPPQDYGYGAELNYGVNLANSAEYKNIIDFFMSIHMNSLAGKDPRGCEALIYPGSPKTTEVATRILANLEKLKFTNRGIKDGTGNSEIDDTICQSMILEVCFVQPSDTALYRQVGMEKVARAIANAINPTITFNWEEYDMNKVVTYKGDIDAMPALLVSQFHGCPLMKEDDFVNSGLKAETVIKVGGKPEDTNRFQTFKNAANLI